MSDQDLQRLAEKQAMKEALQEWLDKQLAEFGWWTLKGLAAAGLVALIALILMSQGWHK
ncbi:hypothetical protein ACO0LF_03805 [Undibacterium sp. Di27W]|uniref:hypothetical protein n=1 Tax=Undibacterium sp. Di27W TaxID=3413036 RepID=UPI003BEFE66B